MRYLVCLDAIPASDGTCNQTAWVEKPMLFDYLPTVGEANTVGFAFFSSLFLIAAAKRFFKPTR